MKGKFLSPEEIASTAVTMTRLARARRIKAVLIGGAAMAHYGSPRMTTDVDFAATSPIRAGSAIAPQRGIVIGKSFVEGGVSVDWIVRNDDYQSLYEDAVLHARRTEDGFAVVTPEHLVAMKLAAARPKDREDALWLLQQPGLVDRKRARRIVHRLLGGQFAAQRLDKWFSIADWRNAHGEESDPGEEED